jgi:hypothetical protein
MVLSFTNHPMRISWILLRNAMIYTQFDVMGHIFSFYVFSVLH